MLFPDAGKFRQSTSIYCTVSNLLICLGHAKRTDPVFIVLICSPSNFQQKKSVPSSRRVVPTAHSFPCKNPRNNVRVYLHINGGKWSLEERVGTRSDARCELTHLRCPLVIESPKTQVSARTEQDRGEDWRPTKTNWCITMETPNHLLTFSY